MRPTDAAIEAAYRDSTVPLRAWAERAGLTLSMLRPHIVRLGLTGRRPSHRGGRPRRLSDAELLAMRDDRSRTLAEIAASLEPPMSQPELSLMFRRLGLGKRPAVRRETVEAVGDSASVADALEGAPRTGVGSTSPGRLRQPDATGVTR